MLDAPAKRPTAPLALRVAFVGEVGRDWLGGWVESVELEALFDAAGGGSRVDAVVVDAHPTGLDRAEARRLLEQVRATGARVIGVPGEADDPVFRGLADLTIPESMSVILTANRRSSAPSTRGPTTRSAIARRTSEALVA